MYLSLKRENYHNTIFLSNFKFTKIPIVQSLVIILIHKVWSWSWNWRCYGHFLIWTLKTWFPGYWSLFSQFCLFVQHFWPLTTSFPIFLDPLGLWCLLVDIKHESYRHFWKERLFSEKNWFSQKVKKIFLPAPENELWKCF